MALIGKIRKNMWLVIVLLALALAGFIIMDMTSGGGSMGNSNTLGVVDGEKIDMMDFQRMEQALYGGGDTYANKASLWNYVIENTIIQNISEDNGIRVGSEELNDLMFGVNLSPIVQSFYRNPQTGQVDRETLNQVKTLIDEGQPVNPEFKVRFQELTKQVIKSQKQTKLSNMVAKAIYTPSWFSNALTTINNESATFDYVSIPFETISDDEIKLTDEDYTAYIQKNASKYTHKEEVRNISYLVYDVIPSAKDSMTLRSKLEGIASGFVSADNDSTYSVQNGGGVTNFIKKDDLPGLLKDTISSLSVGSVIGPYAEEGYYQVAKLIDRKVMADSAKASHILRTVEAGNSIQLAQAQSYIDSIKNEITSGRVSFTDAALANSQDPGSAANGGELGTFAPGMMVPEFNDAVFNGKAGELYKVTTQFGVHLIKVEKLIFESNDMSYKLGFISEPIAASEDTQYEIREKVMGELESVKTLEDLNKLAMGDRKIETLGGLKRNDYTIGDLGSGEISRDIVRWVFDSDTKAGNVSPTLYTYRNDAFYTDGKHVIVALNSVEKAGLASPESVRQSVENELRNQKKGEKIMAMIKSTDLNDIATLFETQVSEAQNITFGNGALPNGSREPSFIARVFKASPGSFVGPVIGTSGVLAGYLKEKIPANVEGGAYSQGIQATMNARMSVNFKLIESLRNNADVKDNRASMF
jgi:peptidyl-prolyl cis-trans isomerase D